MFDIGQMVVCIRDDWRLHGEIARRKDAIYTVRTVELHQLRDGSECIGVRLVEIVNKPRRYHGAFTECDFNAEGFRPLDQRKTSIEIFQRMLTPTSPKKLEPV